jgi:WD40 repeat protein
MEKKIKKAPLGNCIRVFIGHSGSVKFVSFIKGGKHAFSCGDDYSLRVWELATGACIRLSAFDSFWGDEHNSFAATSDGRKVLVGCMFNETKLLDVATGNCIRVFEHCSGIPVSVALSPDGKYAVSGNLDKIGIWELSTGKCLRVFPLRFDSFLESGACLFNSRYAIFALDKDEGVLQLWDVEEGKFIRGFCGHTSSVNSLAVTKDDQYAVSASDDETLRIWKVDTGDCVKVLKEHTSIVMSAVFSPDGRYILSGGSDSTIRLWEFKTGNCVGVYEGHTGGVDAVKFSFDGRYALSGSTDGTVRLWRL